MDCQNCFNGLAKDDDEHEDRRTVFTRWVVHLNGVRLPLFYQSLVTCTRELG